MFSQPFGSRRNCWPLMQRRFFASRSACNFAGALALVVRFLAFHGAPSIEGRMIPGCRGSAPTVTASSCSLAKVAFLPVGQIHDDDFHWRRSLPTPPESHDPRPFDHRPQTDDHLPNRLALPVPGTQLVPQVVRIPAGDTRSRPARRQPAHGPDSSTWLRSTWSARCSAHQFGHDWPSGQQGGRRSRDMRRLPCGRGNGSLAAWTSARGEGASPTI